MSKVTLLVSGLATVMCCWLLNVRKRSVSSLPFPVGPEKRRRDRVAGVCQGNIWTFRRLCDFAPGSWATPVAFLISEAPLTLGAGATYSLPRASVSTSEKWRVRSASQAWERDYMGAIMGCALQAAGRLHI